MYFSSAWQTFGRQFCLTQPSFSFGNDGWAILRRGTGYPVRVAWARSGGCSMCVAVKRWVGCDRGGLERLSVTAWGGEPGPILSSKPSALGPILSMLEPLFSFGAVLPPLISPIHHRERGGRERSSAATRELAEEGARSRRVLETEGVWWAWWQGCSGLWGVDQTSSDPEGGEGPDRRVQGGQAWGPRGLGR